MIKLKLNEVNFCKPCNTPLVTDKIKKNIKALLTTHTELKGIFRKLAINPLKLNSITKPIKENQNNFLLDLLNKYYIFLYSLFCLNL